jgi:hypothetical protein
MLVITAPTYPRTFEKPAIFLGGAITGAADWQSQAVNLLQPAFKTCFNPRRPQGFVAVGQTGYLESYQEQVEWEHTHLLLADVALFWLPKEALAITTRFEIGWLFGLLQGAIGSKPTPALAVGIELGVLGDTYYRFVLPKIGVSIQTTLEATCQEACAKFL